ncbi:MAG: hypothetical protein V2I43_27265 [Parvularcula sp.]|jgi:hypothetical protein|nr:hypothetical protein [Parvularcula sp.]
MTKPTNPIDPEMRAAVIDELSSAVERLALDMPHADAGLILSMAIGFFAGAYAEHFGHAQTAKLLIRTARLGVSLSQSEESFSPSRHAENTAH